MKKEKRVLIKKVSRSVMATALALSLTGAVWMSEARAVRADYSMDALYDDGAFVTSDKSLFEQNAIYAACGMYLADNNKSIAYGDYKEGYLLGLARANYPVESNLYSGYYDSIKKYLSANTGAMASVTEAAKVVAVLNAIGYDPTDVDGVDITKQLDEAESVSGAYGYAYTLIALDSKGYPSDNRDIYIDALLEEQLDNGTWGWDGKSTDIDTTGMVVASLAPYYKSDDKVREAIDYALIYLSNAQSDNGAYSSGYGDNSNTTAMVVLALSELGINADCDMRFIKNGVSVVDALCSYATKSGAFGWTDNIEDNDYATYQAYYALCAYSRAITDLNTLFDMRDEKSSESVLSYDITQREAEVKDAVTEKTALVPIEYIQEGYIYRMYDPNRGEHFYTKNAAERDYLISLGWIHEKDADFVVTAARNEKAKAVYRLYNPNTIGMHFYTEDINEVRSLISLGWNYEGISHYVYDKSSDKGIEQYRLYNPSNICGEHNWTHNTNERDMLIDAGWIYEGVSWKIAG